METWLEEQLLLIVKSSLRNISLRSSVVMEKDFYALKFETEKRYPSKNIGLMNNLNYINWFLPMHQCVLVLYTRYFPESCEKISQPCYSGGTRCQNI